MRVVCYNNMYEWGGCMIGCKKVRMVWARTNESDSPFEKFIYNFRLIHCLFWFEYIFFWLHSRLNPTEKVVFVTLFYSMHYVQLANTKQHWHFVVVWFKEAWPCCVGALPYIGFWWDWVEQHQYETCMPEAHVQDPVPREPEGWRVPWGSYPGRGQGGASSCLVDSRYLVGWPQIDTCPHIRRLLVWHWIHSLCRQCELCSSAGPNTANSVEIPQFALETFSVITSWSCIPLTEK